MADFDDIGTLDDDMPTPEGLGIEASKPPPTPEAAPVKPKVAKSLDFDDIATDDDDLSDLAAKVEASEDQTKEWMRAYGLDHFKLVQDIDQLRAIVDECLAATHFGIDLETEGFDNRIEYGHDLKPQTIHKIVGYCLAVNGTGYYIPVRHAFDPRYGEKDPNIQPHIADPEISRLCWGTQPELGPEDSVFHKLAGPTGKPVACFFNAKFDQEFLFPVTGLDIWHDSSFEDMYLAGYVINSEEGADTGLKEYSERILSFTAKGSDKPVPLKMINFKDLFPKEVKPKDRQFKKLFPQMTYSGKPNAVVTYGCSDALCTLFLCLPESQLPPGVVRTSHFIQDARQPKFLFTYRIEQQTTQAVRVMERSRGLVDKTEILKVQEEAEIELAEIEAKIKQVAAKAGMPDFNPASFPQVAELLYAPNRLDLNPKPEKTSTGQYQTTMSVLEALVEDLGEQAPPVIRWLVVHRQITKAIGTYLTALARDTDENNCLRYNFKQTGTATGRFTAPKGKTDHGFAGIPIQGIPARVDPRRPRCATSLRRIFIARPGYVLVKVDYAGQELRVVTNISGEPVWSKEFLEGTGDLHTLTAQSFWPGLQKGDPDFDDKRKKAKGANFSLVYGGGVQAIMRATGIDKDEAAQKLSLFNGSVPVFAKWVEGQHRAVKQSLGVKSGFNRWMALPDANITEKQIQERRLKAGKPLLSSQDAKKECHKIRAACERKSTNYPIQGSGADILKISLTTLLSALVRRGWIKTGRGGDDSVRMLMTVHDEVVFEVRKERLQEAMPVIIWGMEYASSLRASWPVKLIVEPLVGLSWDAKYDWLAIMAGKKPVPEWLEGHVTPESSYVAPPPKDPQPAPVEAPAAPSEPAPEAPEPSGQAPGEPDPAPEDSQEASQLPRGSKNPAGVVTFTVANPLTEALVNTIGEGLELNQYLLTHRMPTDDTVAILHLKTRDGHVLIAREDNVKVLITRLSGYLTGRQVICKWVLTDG